MLKFLRNVPPVNIQAFVALLFFGVSLFIANIVIKIQSEKWTASPMFLLYLRILLGFVFAASIGLGFYSFAGINILFNK
ncbi:MAG: flagellar biosynthesis protein FliR [Synergistaceae bacterium]|nr:flagellar biosynthesis protein FliR [Synergistaceae bacterium]